MLHKQQKGRGTRVRSRAAGRRVNGPRTVEIRDWNIVRGRKGKFTERLGEKCNRSVRRAVRHGGRGFPKNDGQRKFRRHWPVRNFRQRPLAVLREVEKQVDDRARVEARRADRGTERQSIDEPSFRRPPGTDLVERVPLRPPRLRLGTFYPLFLKRAIDQTADSSRARRTRDRNVEQDAKQPQPGDEPCDGPVTFVRR